jgi:hypothetical protein
MHVYMKFTCKGSMSILPGVDINIYTYNIHINRCIRIFYFYISTCEGSMCILPDLDIDMFIHINVKM